MDTRMWGGILLVAGTTVGAAMLALPVATGMAGLIPSIFLFLAFWFFMGYTALLFVEVNSWTGSGSNMITMAKQTLGGFGAITSWSTYLFLLYALLTAYIAGSGAILNDLLALSSPTWCSALPMVSLFALLLYYGMRPFDYLNRILMIGLVVAYIAMVTVLVPHISAEKLTHVNLCDTLLGVSLVSTSFGFHIIIPSLYRYLGGSIPLIKRTLFIGSLIPLIVYLSWEVVTLGIIPVEGPLGLHQGYRDGAQAVHLLIPAVHDKTLALLGELFSLCAITTSFLGVALSLNDCLADGLKIKRSLQGQLSLLFLTFTPPLLIAAFQPRAFLSALEYAGAFGVVSLLGLLPAFMVWNGRYRQKRTSIYKAPGGKPALLLTMFFAASVILIEVGKKLTGWQ